jgi:hypothetical protein
MMRVQGTVTRPPALLRRIAHLLRFAMKMGAHSMALWLQR